MSSKNYLLRELEHCQDKLKDLYAQGYRIGNWQVDDVIERKNNLLNRLDAIQDKEEA